ncbi:MAG: hypothetical protein GX660_08775 [Clostridiaceae bacterium]|mgnify:CR=1 FL=1|nr:hypothetical protein [Clostridiaceae bacterium]
MKKKMSLTDVKNVAVKTNEESRPSVAKDSPDSKKYDRVFLAQSKSKKVLRICTE